MERAVKELHHKHKQAAALLVEIVGGLRLQSPAAFPVIPDIFVTAHRNRGYGWRRRRDGSVFLSLWHGKLGGGT